MRLRNYVVVAATLCLVLAIAARPACSPAPPSSQREHEVLSRYLQASPVRRVDFWRDTLARPLAQRIGPASPEMLAFLRATNQLEGFKTFVHASKASPQFRSDVEQAIAELPAPVIGLVKDRLAGIYFVEGLGSSGFTELVQDDSGKPVAAFVVLDSGELTGRRANQWATWKESTPFTGDSAKLEVAIEDKAANTTAGAVQYILLHELGHVTAVGRRLDPIWITPTREIGRAEDFPFFAQSWRVRDERIVSLFDDQFILRSDVVYYLGARLDASRMIDTYTQLAATNFPTLYAATSYSDDFAESFANYVHTVLLHKPFAIVIHDGDRVMRYGACWDEPRCAGKRRILEELLETRHGSP